MITLTQLWRTSLTVRRIAAAAVFVAATGVVYLAAEIPRSVLLPYEDLNKRSLANFGQEELVLENPKVAEGEDLISYTGDKDELADFWLNNAALNPASQALLFPADGPQQNSRIGFTTANVLVPIKYDDTCRTSIVIQRSKGSPAIKALLLYQTDQIAGTERYRQIVLDTGGVPVDVVFHTDAPPTGATNLPGCQKSLTIGSKSITLPNLPFSAHASDGIVSLRFSAVTAADDIYTGPDATFDTVSLGGNDLRCTRLQVVTRHSPETKARLDIKPAVDQGLISVGGLQIGSKWIQVSVGPDGEKVLASADGKAAYTYNLVAFIQENPVLGWLFASVLIPGLGLWLKATCFPNTASVVVKDQQS